MDKFKLSVADHDDNVPVQWILAEFSHGPVVRGLDGGGDKVISKVEREKGGVVRVELESAHLRLEGRTGPQEEERGSVVVVGVVDRRRKRIMLQPPSSTLVVSLAPSVKGYVPVEPEDHADVNRGTYVREFASHKEHKRLKSFMDAYVRGEQVVVGEHMEKARDTAREQMASYANAKTLLVPPFDPETADASRIYSMRTMLNDGLQGAILELMCECFNGGLPITEGDGGLVKEDAGLRLVEVVDGNLQDFFTASIKHLSELERRFEREHHVLAMGFVLAMASYLLNRHPSREQKGHFTSKTFDAAPSAFANVCRLLDEEFAARAHNEKRSVLSPHARIRCLNFATVAMLLALPGRQLRLRMLADGFGLLDTAARIHASSVGLRPTTFASNSDPTVRAQQRARATYVLRAPLALPNRGLKQPPQSFSNKKEDANGEGLKVRTDAGLPPKNAGSSSPKQRRRK